MADTLKPPPFYYNFDDTHCVQCVLRGVLESFEPTKTHTWEDLDTLTGKEPGKWTWPYRLCTNLSKIGYEIIVIDATDDNDYLEFGIYETLVKMLGVEAANKQREMADLDKVKQDLEEYITLQKQGNLTIFVRSPNLQDYKDYLSQGFLISSSLNSRVLDGRDGSGSHAVLVYGIDDEYVYLHDSNWENGAQKAVPHALFQQASTSPTAQQWSIMALRKRAA
jgi:hypothetical protein